MMLILSALLASAVMAQSPDCLSDKKGYYAVRVENAADNFTILAEPKRFAEVCNAGIAVANGTFFTPGAPLGDVIVGGDVKFPIPQDARRFKRGDRSIDLGKRWGIGVLRGGRLGISDGDTALKTMDTYLGGGGLLLSDGQDVSTLNESVAGQWGPSMPRSVIDDERGRTALGIKEENGAQVLLLVSSKDSARATASGLAAIMKSLGASEAVFYDGGGAHGFAAGGKCLISPSNKGEDLNPTHIIIAACR